MKKHIDFFEKYHRGAVNVLLHDIGFALWGLGIGKHNFFLIVFSPFVFESGHLYNYLRGIHTEGAKQTIIPQLLTWIVFVTLGYLLTKILL